MATTLMMSAKMVSPDLLKIKVFWNKGYDVTIFVHDVTNEIFSRDSNYIVDVVMWPKFGKCSISTRKVIIISILWGLDQKNCSFEGCFLLEFNNLGPAVGMNLKFYTNMAKGSKLKVRKFWGLIFTFVEVAGE